MDNLSLFTINGESILAITLFGENRSQEVLKWQKKVMVEHFGIPVNYIKCPFPSVSHGQMMNLIIKETIDSLKPDYYWFIDNDAIILKKETIRIMYELVKNKNGIAGHAQQSNHKKNKTTQSFIHPYASQAFLWFPSSWYRKIGSPCMDHWSDDSDEYGGDTAERLTYQTKANGGIVSLIYPSEIILKNSPLDAGFMFGMGNTFSDLVFHAMQQNNPESEILFINKCKEVIEKHSICP